MIILNRALIIIFNYNDYDYDNDCIVLFCSNKRTKYSSYSLCMNK